MPDKEFKHGFQAAQVLRNTLVAYSECHFQSPDVCNVYYDRQREKLERGAIHSSDFLPAPTDFQYAPE
ncbi:MAG: hypothetical protein WC073_06200 [Sterolibacterium sp.]